MYGLIKNKYVNAYYLNIAKEYFLNYVIILHRNFLRDFRQDNG